MEHATTRSFVRAIQYECACEYLICGSGGRALWY